MLVLLSDALKEVKEEWFFSFFFGEAWVFLKIGRDVQSKYLNGFQNTSLRFFVDKMVRDGDGRACRITCGEEKEMGKQIK